MNTLSHETLLKDALQKAESLISLGEALKEKGIDIMTSPNVDLYDSYSELITFLKTQFTVQSFEEALKTTEIYLLVNGKMKGKYVYVA